MKNYTTIKNPVYTEKANSLSTDTKKVYQFDVMKDAGKIEIAMCFHGLYGVKPESVRTIKVVKKVRPRDGAVKRHVSKRAVITLPKGVDIDITKIK
jgi:ribosomal protein L23